MKRIAELTIITDVGDIEIGILLQTYDLLQEICGREGEIIGYESGTQQHRGFDNKRCISMEAIGHQKVQ